MIRATISADVIASSALSSSEIDLLTQRIYFIFDKIREYHENNNREKVMCRLVSGDLIECLAYDPHDALRIALIIKAGIKSFSLDKNTHNMNIVSNKYRRLFENNGVRVSIGIGDMDVDLIDKDILKGEAINLSGRLISNQKTSSKERVVIKNTLFFGSYDEKQTSIFQTIMSLLDTIYFKMTQKQCETVFWKLAGYSEQNIAGELGITQSSINQRSTGAGWTSIEDALNLFSTFDFQR